MTTREIAEAIEELVLVLTKPEKSKSFKKSTWNGTEAAVHQIKNEIATGLAEHSCEKKPVVSTFL